MWGDKAQVAVRFALVCIMLFAYGLIKKQSIKLSTNSKLYAVGLGIAFASVVLCFTASIQKTTIANAMFTFYAATMISSFLFGTILFKETVNKKKLAAIALALGGLSVYSDSLIAGSIGILLGVSAGISDGFANVFRKKLSGTDSIAVLKIQFLVGVIFNFALLLITKEQIIRTASFVGALNTIIFSIVILAAGFLVLYGFQNFDVNVGAVIMSSEIVVAVILAFIFYQEVPSAHELTGGLLILFASILSAFNEESFKKLKLNQLSQRR